MLLLLTLTGLIAGSLIYRLATSGTDISLHRAALGACDACGRPVRPIELIPVAGSLAARQPCPGCGTERPVWPRLACEAMGGLVAITAWAFAPAGTLLLSCLFGWTLLALSVVDLKRYILPDGLNALGAGFGLVMIWLTRPEAWADHMIGAAAGYLVFLAVELAYRHGRRRDGLGRGDAKLLGMIGLWTGWIQLPDILLIASLSGLIAALASTRLTGRTLDGGSAIAFGPWLALAGWISWLSGPILVAAY